jgi:hypothetical protein
LKDVDAGTGVTILAAGVAAVAVVILYVWFGASLIRLRDRIGGTAAVAGWGYLVGVLVSVIFVGWFVSEVIAAADQPGAMDKDLDDLVGPQLRTAAAFGLVGGLSSAALTTMLFMSVRHRGEDQGHGGVAPG